MKRFFRQHLLNIVFLVLIVAGALTIYFLSRAERKADASVAAKETIVEASAASAMSDADETPASGEFVKTAAPVNTASAVKRPRGVPEAVFATHLSTSDLFESAVSADDPRLWTLTYGQAPAVIAALEYTVDSGAISSLEFSFPLAPEYDQESDSAIEQYLANSQDRLDEARAEAIRVLLTDLLPACDLNDSLSHASVRLWAEEALRISSKDDDYIQKSEGCSFLAYQTTHEEEGELVCLFFLEN